MLLRAKPGVVTNVSFELAVITGYVLRCWMEAGLGPFVITSLNDGTHRRGSRHYSGHAVDIRTRACWTGGWEPPFPGCHVPRMVEFVDTLKTDLTPHGVLIILHPDDDTTRPRHFPHLHVEYNPKPQQDRTLWTRE